MRGTTAGTRLRQCGVAIVAVWLGACTELSAGGDLAQGQGSLQPTGDWSCLPLSAPVGRDARRDESIPIQYSLPVAALIGPPPQNLRARVCDQNDVDCVFPRSEVNADANGVVSVPLFAGFDGFIEITAEDMISTKFYPFDDLYEDGGYGRPFLLAPVGSLDPLAEASQSTFMGGLAHVSAHIHDCEGVRASGVELGKDVAEGLPFYFADGLPTARVSQTDSLGFAGFLNLQEGELLLTAKRAGVAGLVAERRVVTRSEWFTTVSMRPR